MNRRSFLATAATTGVLMQTTELAWASTEALEVPDLTRDKIPTPALVLDLDMFESNLKVMASHCRTAGCGFRPHSKTHKCPEIARRQIAAGALGVCAATLPEVQAMVDAGIRGVLLTSPIMEPAKISRFVDLVRRGADIMLSVGHVQQVDALASAADAAKVTINLMIDVDVGDRRTGILPGQPALELAKHIGAQRRLQLKGVQAYAGHAAHVVGFETRERVSREAMAKAVETRQLLNKSGFDVGILSGGSTGTYNIDSSIQGVTELQVGSFVFMDVDYRRIGGKSGAVYTDFQPSLGVLSTVVSTTHPDRVTIDAGTKSLDTTVAHKPEVKGWQGLVYNRGGDEFGVLSAAGGEKLPRLGDRVEFIVPHCDPTANLYNCLFAVRGNSVEGIWPIAASRFSAALPAASAAS